MERIRGARALRNYPFFEAAAGDCHLRAGRPREARTHFQRAIRLARNDSERRVLAGRLAASASGR